MVVQTSKDMLVCMCVLDGVCYQNVSTAYHETGGVLVDGDRSGDGSV